MSDWQLQTPVAFIIFNRPDTTERVFAEIARAKPPMLLVVADGPRVGRPGEAERCEESRAIIDRINWDCDVLTNFSEVNLGCKKRVASGLDWVFEQVPEAIILEDDCLPHPLFFRFCAELLERYRNDDRIAMISGDNFQFGRKRGDSSYYFSRYNHIWGWASWRRAWQHYDCDAGVWPTVKENSLLDVLIKNPRERKYWADIFQSVYEGKIDTWDYQWSLTTWSQGMVSVMPSVNLISNIGFGGNATHTHGESVYSAIPVEDISFPLRHPGVILPHPEADAFTARGMFSASLVRRVMDRVRMLLLSSLKI